MLKRAFNNITWSAQRLRPRRQGQRDLELPRHDVHGIGVTKAGACGSADGANTVGFGPLPAGYLALTCVRSVGTSIVEADIRLGSGVSWALALGACFHDYMLEAVATHEIGTPTGSATSARRTMAG